MGSRTAGELWPLTVETRLAGGHTHTASTTQAVNTAHTVGHLDAAGHPAGMDGIGNGMATPWRRRGDGVNSDGSGFGGMTGMRWRGGMR